MPAASTDLETKAERLAERLRAAGHWVSLDLRVNLETAAEILGAEEKTLVNWRAAGHPLRSMKPAGRITYYLVDLIAFIESDVDRAA
jgi:hypothetical protein